MVGNIVSVGPFTTHWQLIKLSADVCVCLPHVLFHNYTGGREHLPTVQSVCSTRVAKLSGIQYFLCSLVELHDAEEAGLMYSFWVLPYRACLVQASASFPVRFLVDNRAA